MSLNEFAGYGAVALAAMASGYLASIYGLRPVPFYLGIAFAAFRLLLLLVVRDTTGHAREEARLHVAGSVAPPPFREVFARTTYQPDPLHVQPGRVDQQPERWHGLGLTGALSDQWGRKCMIATGM